MRANLEEPQDKHINEQKEAEINISWEYRDHSDSKSGGPVNQHYETMFAS